VNSVTPSLKVNEFANYAKKGNNQYSRHVNNIGRIKQKTIFEALHITHRMLSNLGNYLKNASP
jgi:hypothetical protein